MYTIGIDTGGTCTDAALIHTATGEVKATAKVDTTHHRLAVGTARALEKILAHSAVSVDQIKALNVSTTLATNAVVEKKGARVGLFVIGYVKHFKLPVVAVVFIKGGHTIQGVEEEPLDIENLIDTVSGLKSEVDAYAICSAMSMENPTHELVAEKAISMLDPKPVFCSHRISHHAGMLGRAATAALHAKLMPLMQDFVAGIKVAMLKLQLDCPMTIISGDGKPVSMEKAVERAGITVASGPACTAHFGGMQKIDNCLVIDVGGTTTDIAMIRDGRPLLTEDGCRIGDWQTHVQAVNMVTGGIGGDSHVRLDEKGTVSLGPSRVISLSMDGLPSNPEDWLGYGKKSKRIELQKDLNAPLPDDPILRYLQEHGAATPHTIHQETGLSGVPLEKRLEWMAREQLITESGFTPTDALHVLGRTDLGDRESALAGAIVLADIYGSNVDEFCQHIVRMTEDKIENMIIDYIIHLHWGKSLTSFVESRNNHPILGVKFSLKVPLVGAGAAARFFLPSVARRLGTTVVFPEYCDVGNAVGAAMMDVS